MVREGVSYAFLERMIKIGHRASKGMVQKNLTTPTLVTLILATLSFDMLSLARMISAQVTTLD